MREFVATGDCPLVFAEDARARSGRGRLALGDAILDARTGQLCALRAKDRQVSLRGLMLNL